MSEKINEQMLEALNILLDAKDLKDSEGNKSINYLAKKAEGWAKARYAVKQANEATTKDSNLPIEIVSDLLKSYNNYLTVEYNGASFDDEDIETFIKRFL